MTHTFTLYPGIKYLTDIPTLHTGCGRPTDHIRLCYVNPLDQVYGIPEYSDCADITVYPIPVSMLVNLGTWDRYQRFDIPDDVIQSVKNNRTIIVFDGSGESTDILGSVTSGRVSDFLEHCGLEDHTYNTIVNTCVYHELPRNNVIVTTGHDITDYSDKHFMWCNMNMVEAVLNPAPPEFITQRLSQIKRGIVPDYNIISHNGRARAHKVLLMQGLYHRGITQNNLISCDSISGSGGEVLMQQLQMPWRHSDIRDAQPPSQRGQSLTHWQAWHTHYHYYYAPESQRELLRSGVYLSTETWGHDVPLALGRFHHVSEKSYRAIVSGMPFVSWSQNHTLARLHSQGYETFSHYWSEQSDSEPDPDLKTTQVLDICEHISDMSKSDISELMHLTWQICEHNYHNYFERWHARAHASNLIDMLDAWESV